MTYNDILHHQLQTKLRREELPDSWEFTDNSFTTLVFLFPGLLHHTYLQLMIGIWRFWCGISHLFRAGWWQYDHNEIFQRDINYTYRRSKCFCHAWVLWTGCGHRYELCIDTQHNLSWNGSTSSQKKRACTAEAKLVEYSTYKATYFWNSHIFLEIKLNYAFENSKHHRKDLGTC